MKAVLITRDGWTLTTTIPVNHGPYLNWPLPFTGESNEPRQDGKFHRIWVGPSYIVYAEL